MPAWFNAIGSLPHLARIARYSEAELASVCEISSRQLQRHFRGRKGDGNKFYQWLTWLRLRDGKRLLGRKKPVKEVAFLLGYKQPSHFSREFKKQFGIPPQQLPHTELSEIDSDYFEHHYRELLATAEVCKRNLSQRIAREKEKKKSQL